MLTGSRLRKAISSSENQDFGCLLISQVVPYLGGVMLNHGVLRNSAFVHSICGDNVAIAERLGVAHGQWPVLNRSFQRLPNTENMASVKQTTDGDLLMSK